MFDNKKTELMIVCDEKTTQYANYLVQLIGQKDDRENDVIGTKDDAVTAAIFTEKEYKNTQAKITSNTHILFVGNNKTTKEQAKFIDFKLNKYGMNYGWRGKRAVMFVDESLKKDDYNNFIDFAKKYQLEYEKKNKNNAKAEAAVIVSGVAAAWLLTPIVAVPLAVFGLLKSSKLRSELKEQQYRCLTLALYMDDLHQFLEA